MNLWVEAQNGVASLLSPQYIMKPKVNCLTLFRHWLWFARFLAEDNAGSSMAARMAMMAITTNNSINVKAFRTPSVRDQPRKEGRKGLGSGDCFIGSV